jgi:glyoxylase-like metal-dependent hydrolase (beta-lactamase superfamily II)
MKNVHGEKGPHDFLAEKTDIERVKINDLFDVTKYGDLWEVTCREDRVSTVCGAFYILYLRNMHRSLLIDAGFVRHEKDIRQVFDRFGEELGVGLDGVIAVLCTHLHADHVGNPEMFPRATYYADRDALDLLNRSPEEALHKNFQYQNANLSFTMGDEVADLVRIIDGMRRRRPDWIQPLSKCPYADRGLLVDLFKHALGLRWGKTPGHAAGHCSFVLHLPYCNDVPDRSDLARYRHIFLGDCLAQDPSPGVDGINLGRRWIRSLGLRQLKRYYSIHPSHRLSNDVRKNVEEEGQ